VNKAKVLLVDDYGDNLLVLETLLKSDDFELLTAQSGREALEILLVHDVAVALLDVHMPEMDGFELAQLMRGTEKTRQIPILFITAAPPSQQRLFDGYSIGAVDFMYKPIDAHILKSKVDVFVQLYRQKQQIAEQLDQQREMLRLNEMLCAAIAHDLRNPLQSIAAGAMLAMKQSSNEQVVRSSAERIHGGCVRMTKLISDLLDFSNARLTGSLPMKISAANLLDVTTKVVAEHQLADANAKIEVSSRGDLNGTWDEGRMCQVVSNLIGNALAHGDRSQPIGIHVDGSAANVVVFSIQNEGRIPPAVLPHIFDPFRSSPRSAGTSSGLGLGLYIVEQIVKTHGGTIAVDSTGTTRFVVTLPRHTATPNTLSRTLTA
jgi:two-component system, sensor histidine kinase and response regulator